MMGSVGSRPGLTVMASWDLQLVDITRKLQLEWVQYGQALYLFQERAMSWYQARAACENQQSALVSVEDEDEEEFLESKVRGAHQDSWIGLYSLGGWKWADGSNFEKNHWGFNYPYDSVNKPCAVLPTKCTVPKNCWMNINCAEQRRHICKKRPDKRWFS